MKLSIVIPVYNEKNTIEEILRTVEKAPLPEGIKEREIIVVDDCSRDGTRDYLSTLKKAPFKVLFHEKNTGKGGALRTGFRNATGDIVLIQDADLEYDPNEYPKLLKPIIEDRADVVYGSRFVGDEPHRVLYFWHTVANQLLTLLSNMFSDLNLTDMETCYKVFRKNIIDRFDIEENRFGFEPEITAKIGELSREEDCRVYEVGISYYGRTYKEGKKIGMKDAFRTFWCIFSYNTSRFAHLVKYGFNGLLVALSQFAVIVLLIDGLGFKTAFLQNISNAVSIEVSIIAGFILHSIVTWRYRYKNAGEFITKCLQFHLITGISFVARVLLFSLLLNMGMHYKLNKLIGIGVAILMNFIGYDFLVFKKKTI
jgi:glycosyltransferase involved in cell wall biosynthesis